MQNIPAKTVYIDPAVLELENCQARWERMKPFIRCDDIRSLDEEAKADISKIRQRRHGKDDFGDDAVLVFTTLNEDRWKWYHNWRDAGNIFTARAPPS